MLNREMLEKELKEKEENRNAVAQGYVMYRRDFEQKRMEFNEDVYKAYADGCDGFEKSIMELDTIIRCLKTLVNIYE